MAVVVAPALRTNYPNDWGRIVTWLKNKGVTTVMDVSFGADITTWAYLKYAKKAIKEGKKPTIVAQPCPSVVRYIRRYKKNAIELLAPIHSPTLCSAVYLKKYQNWGGKIAFLSPCLGKMTEFTDPKGDNLVQYNVTFARLIEKHRHEWQNLSPSNFDVADPLLGHLFSTPGGLRENVEYHIPSASVMQTE